MVSKFFSGLAQRKPKNSTPPSDDSKSKSATPAVKRFVDVGALLEQRYRLDAELGRGGMGVVYRAHDIVLDRDVAVKVLYADQTTPETRASLVREAEITTQLDHPNIIAVYHTGEVDTGASQTSPIVVTE